MGITNRNKTELEVGMDASDVKSGVNDIRLDFKRLESQINSSFKSIQNSVAAPFNSLRSSLNDIKTLIGVAFAGTAVKELAVGMFNLNSKFMSTEAALTAATGSTSRMREEMDFVHMAADRLGLDFFSLADSYTKFSIAAKSAGFEQDKIREIFNATAGAARVLNLDNERLQRAFIALQQIMSKGTLNAEEIRQQFAEHIPGGFQIAERAVGKFGKDFTDAMKKGQISAEDLFKNFAEEMNKVYGTALPAAINTSTAEFGRLHTQIQFTMSEFGKAMEPLFVQIAKLGQEGVKGFSSIISPQEFANTMRDALAGILDITATVSETIENNPMVIEGGILGFLLLGGKGSLTRKLIIGGGLGALLGTTLGDAKETSETAYEDAAKRVDDLTFKFEELLQFQKEYLATRERIRKGDGQGMDGFDQLMAGLKGFQNSGDITDEIQKVAGELEEAKVALANFQDVADHTEKTKTFSDAMREAAKAIREVKAASISIEGPDPLGANPKTVPGLSDKEVKELMKRMNEDLKGSLMMVGTVVPKLGEVDWAFKDMVANMITEAGGLKTMTDGLTDAFMNMAKGVSGSFEDMAMSVIDSLERMLIQYYVVKPILDAAGAYFGIPGASSGAQGYPPVDTGSTDFSGYADVGNMIPSGKWGIAGEKGPEIVSGPATVVSRKDTEHLMKGGGGGAQVQNNINIQTPPGYTADTEETKNDSGGMDMSVIIRQIEGQIASNVSNRKGPLFKTMQDGGFKGNIRS